MLRAQCKMPRAHFPMRHRLDPPDSQEQHRFNREALFPALALRRQCQVHRVSSSNNKLRLKEPLLMVLLPMRGPLLDKGKGRSRAT